MARGERLRVSGAMTTRFASFRSPMVTGSNKEAMDTFPLSGKDQFQDRLKIGQSFDEGCDCLLITLIESPLTDTAGCNQPRFRQDGQMGRNGRLGQAAPFELARTHAHLQRHVLIGKMILRFLKPAQNVETHRIGECLEYFIQRNSLNIRHRSHPAYLPMRIVI